MALSGLPAIGKRLKSGDAYDAQAPRGLERKNRSSQMKKVGMAAWTSHSAFLKPDTSSFVMLPAHTYSSKAGTESGKPK